jgi:hypothetical protein
VDRLGIEHQTVFGLPPLEFVRLAGDLGCGHIAVVLAGTRHNPLIRHVQLSDHHRHRVRRCVRGARELLSSLGGRAA